MALAVSAVAGALLGAILALALPWMGGELGVLGGSAGSVALFSLGAGLTAATLVLDQALVGLSRGMAQLRRNVAFAASKLGLLYLAGTWLGNSGLLILATWVAGIVISLVIIARRVPWTRWGPAGVARAWAWIRGLGRTAAAHHTLNLVLQAPGQTLPLIVTAVLSAEVNAGFYVAWMVAGMVFVAPESLATVLYTSSVADPAELPRRLKRLGVLSLGWGVAANLGLWLLAGPMLTLFGQSYASTATAGLNILALGVFPLLVRFFYVAVRRIEGRIVPTAALMAGGALLEVAAATAGAHRAGLAGLCTGWVLALSLEALLLAPAVGRAIRHGAQPTNDPVVSSARPDSTGPPPARGSEG
jgi:hypothetical protein